VSFILSSLILGLILLIPVKIYQQTIKDQMLEVLLIKDKLKSINTVTGKEIKPLVQPKPINKPIPQKPVKKVTIVEQNNKKHQSLAEPKKTIKEKKLPSAATILTTKSNFKLEKLDPIFQARTGHEEDFKQKIIEPPKWNQVTKLINEEIDKPRIEMNFYSPGVVGATERFFDKITYKKTFTTRYGTKIYCGGIGPLLICGWK
jgi:hypothetical protein